MRDPSAFFDALKPAPFGQMTQPQVDGLNTLLAAMAASGWGTASAAYGLATAFHETARTMQPIHEYGSSAYLAKYDTGPLAARLGNTPQADGDGQKYAGRGFVQLTGHANYEKAGNKLGVDLVGNPDLALQPTVAARVMVQGMASGWFTGKKLADYLPAIGGATFEMFRRARRIINGVDKDAEIAVLALQFQSALQKGGW